MNKFMITSSVLALTFLVSIFSGVVYATQDSSDTETALEVDSIINISAPSTVTLNCTPGYTDAAAELCTNTASVYVTTNNLTGYTLQMNATNGSPTALTNSATSPTATIPTLSGAYTSANFPVNYWGYTGGLDKSSESGGYDCSTNYCPILAYQSNDSNYAPNHVIKVTDAPATTSATTITFAGKVNIDKPSGTYTTSVTFTAVANHVPGPIDCTVSSTACEIVYDNNGSTSNNGIGATSTNLYLNGTMQPYPSNDYKTDHGFAGWSTDPNAGSKISSSNASTRNRVTVYGPYETVTITQDLLDANIEGTITLYAVWVPSTGSMQSFDTTACNNLAGATYTNGTIIPGQITARKDSRDNNTYAIAKLTDGRCWMMENLRLDENIALNSTNTQNPIISTTPANSTSRWYSDGVTANHLRNDNITSPAINPTSKNANIYSYGVYYTWYTATAGNNPSSDTTTGSICPANWSLPYGSSAYNTTPGSFYYLADTMNTTSDATKSKSLRHFPNNFVFSGMSNGEAIGNRSSNGYWWSRTANSSSNAYYLYFLGNYFYPLNNDAKQYGYPLRCIAGS